MVYNDSHFPAFSSLATTVCTFFAGDGKDRVADVM